MPADRVPPRLLLRIFLFTMVAPAAMLVYFPLAVLHRSAHAPLPPPPSRAVPGALLIAAGAAIYLRCTWDFATRGGGTPAPLDPPRRLIVEGLYRRTRNPMYHGVLLAIAAEAWTFRSIALGLYGLSALAGFHLFVRLYEEPTLRRDFGDAYDRYCREVPRWGIARRPFTG